MNSTIKAPRQDSGDTNISGITWKRYGKVVTVSCGGVASSGGTQKAITGLPTPKDNAYINAILFYGGNVIGYIQCYNGYWAYSSNNMGYGACTFICE